MTAAGPGRVVRYSVVRTCQAREQHDVEHLAQVRRAAGAAGALLEADDALDGRYVTEAPLAERILEIDEFLGHLVVLLRMTVHLEPRGFDRLVVPGRLRPVALEPLGRDREAAPREQAHDFVVERRRFERRTHLFEDVGPVRMRLQHLHVLVAEQEFELPILVRLETRRLPRYGRIAEYSDGVIVDSTFHACTSCSRIRDTRASILNAGGSASVRTASRAPRSSNSASFIHSSLV